MATEEFESAETEVLPDQYRIAGRTIEEARPMTDAELEREYWNPVRTNSIALALDNGTKVYPSQDSEGNGPGELLGFDFEPETLVGHTITTVREMADEKLKRYFPHGNPHANPIELVLDDSRTVYAARDPEMNGPGALFGYKGGPFRVIPHNADGVIKD